jgi:hypothetical protein
MLTALAWLTHWKTKIKVSDFSGTLEHSRTVQTKCIVNQLQLTHHRRC